MEYWCNEDGYRKEEIDAIADAVQNWIDSTNKKEIYTSTVQIKMVIGKNKALRVLECLCQRGKIKCGTDRWYVISN